MTTNELSRWFAGLMRLGRADALPEPLLDVEARVRAAVEALPIVLFEVDAQGRYTCVAGGYVSLFGITQELLIGRSIFDFPRFVPGKNMMVRRALAGEAVSFTGIWPRGRYMIRLVPRFDEHKRVIAVIGLGHDVAKPAATDRHFEELLEALRQSEARFRAMCDCAPLGIVVSNPRLELGYVNPAFCTMLDASPQDLLGSRWESLLHPDERDRLRTARAEQRTVPVASCVRFVRSDGQSVWTSLRMAAMHEGSELLGYVAVVADITQERAVRSAMDGARDDLRRVIEGSPEGIAIVRDQRWVFVNRALVQTLGYGSAQALLGQPATDLVHPDDRALAQQLFARPADLRLDADGFELRARSASGEYMLLELRPATLSEFEGAPATLISARDITEKKKLQARLAVTERLLAVGTLAAGVAHEVNNPLSAVLSNLEWVAAQLARTLDDDRPRSREELRAVLERLVKPVDDAREACGRVRGIVQDLKLLSRGDEEQLVPVDLPQVIDAAVRMAWNELRHRARLVREYGDVPLVHGNEARLAQVFLNLLINATQAIPEGHADEHEVRVTTRAGADDQVIVEVRDSGCGIPEQILGRIFDPFFTTKPPGIGTGLGLSICQRLISGMRGQIEVESKVGMGSTFRVTLHGALSQARESGRAEQLAPLPSPRARLLIIDDDPAVSGALQLMLADEHDVTVFTSARPALERLHGGDRFDVILCDLMMPDMSGMDFHAELYRSRPDLAQKIIFLTGGAFTTRAREFLDETNNTCLNKPFNWRELRTLIARSTDSEAS